MATTIKGKLVNGPNVVRDGLALQLDAASTRSYSGSGTAWNDVSGNNISGVLTNGPSFSSNNYGAIGFDGIDDYVSLSSGTITSGSVTMIFWINGTYQNYALSIFERGNSTGAGLSSKRIPYNGWCQVGFIGNSASNKFILNGSVYSADTGAGFPYDNATYKPIFWMGSFGYFGSNSGNHLMFHLQPSPGGVTGFTWSNYSNKALGIMPTSANRRYFTGTISSVLIYNRVLSNDEVLQNYNAQKVRFLTDIQLNGFYAEVLVAAGGGGGGGSNGGYPGGGGGAGGLIYSITTTYQLGIYYKVTVGAGGAAATVGSDTTFGSMIAKGGGNGGNNRSSAGGNGGSGGGGASNYPPDIGSPYLTPYGVGVTGQGNNGAYGKSVYANTQLNGIPGGGGGGGGAGTPGYMGMASPLKGGDGGFGGYYPQFSTFGGSPSGWFAAGGGGSNQFANSTLAGQGLGGTGGGGRGSYGTASDSKGQDGVVNTGSGGGGGAYNVATSNAGAGGSGIIIIKIPTACSATFSSGVTYTMSSAVAGFYVYTVTATSTTSETIMFI